MFTNPSLTTRIGVGKLIGFLIGLAGFFTLPIFAPEADPMLRWGILLWYATMGAIIGVYGVYTYHPVLHLPLPWWIRAPMIGGWLNFVLVFFAHAQMHTVLVAMMGETSAFTSPWWFVAAGVVVGLVIAALAGVVGRVQRRHQPDDDVVVAAVEDGVAVEGGGEVAGDEEVHEQGEVAGVGWILAVDWVPYQRPTFVTPSFAGYVSGHSTFSRAASELMTLLTGSEYFPGGLGEWPIEPGALEFESGPDDEIVLQWATYADASDEAGVSRLYGGIHVPADDLRGREIGFECGTAAWELAQSHFDGSVAPR